MLIDQRIQIIQISKRKFQGNNDRSRLFLALRKKCIFDRKLNVGVAIDV